MLMEMDKNNNTTQYELSKKSNIVSSMVNNYMKRFVENGYVEKTGNNRNTTYNLTSKGKEYKNYLLVSYLSELMDIIKSSEEYLQQTIINIVGKEDCRIMLFGAGETGKICAKILKNMSSISIVGYIDDDTSKTHKQIEGFQIFTIEDASKIRFDKVLITTFQNIRDIKDRLSMHIDKSKILLLE